MNRIDTLFKEWQDLQPIKEEYQQRINQKFMLEFNYNSNHIEGNTLTYGQTEMLLMFGKSVDEANMKDLEEMKASNVGLKMVQEAALDKEQPLSEYFIKNLHKTLLREDYKKYSQLPDGTQTSCVIHAGQYKTRPNTVITVTEERFEYASPEETPALMKDLIEWYKREEAKGEMTPIELASLFHYRYIRIHPFEDGNGRISRLIVNYILCRHGYPMIVVKTTDKNNYLTSLNRCDVTVGPIPSDGAHAELSQITPFVEYMEKCLERALTISIKGAKGESIEEADDWRKNLKLKYRNQMNQPEGTEEERKELLNNDFSELLKYIDNELSEFYSLFAFATWGFGRGKCDKNGHSDICFSIEHNGLGIPVWVNIDITFRQFFYRISVTNTDSKSQESKIYENEYSYSKKIAEQDKTDIINAIGNFLNQFIEKYKR
ncbi:MAG: Fic family protein [Paludibacteraceae bacterium]|nr:Fic family protein [Paludibacteraceae bacterium]